MPTKKLGRQTVAFADPPAIIGHANVVGKKEGDGPLADSFDHIEQDDKKKEKTWEKLMISSTPLRCARSSTNCSNGSLNCS